MTWRKWRPLEAAKPHSSGRKAKLTPAQIGELTTMAHGLVNGGGPFSVNFFQHLVNDQVKPLRVSKSWCIGFLKGIGLSFKSIGNHRESLRFSPEQQKDIRYQLMKKVGLAGGPPRREPAERGQLGRNQRSVGSKRLEAVDEQCQSAAACASPPQRRRSPSPPRSASLQILTGS